MCSVWMETAAMQGHGHILEVTVSGAHSGHADGASTLPQPVPVVLQLLESPNIIQIPN